MHVEILGKFYDNHSLSLVNRNLAIMLNEIQDDNFTISIFPLDAPNPENKVDKQIVKTLLSLETKEDTIPDIQLRHSYPPIWAWPDNEHTKVVYIQPWEYQKVPFEWQYKFETFADALIVPSNFTKDAFLKGGINPSKLHVIPNGYNERIFNLDKQDPVIPLDKDKFTFIFVGNTQWRKGLDILLNAWANTFKAYDNVQLIIKDNPNIYGQTSIVNEIVRMQYKTDCGKIIYIPDNLSDAEIASLYKNSQVLVHPYRAEGFGMHVQEAIACGVFPIVSGGGSTDDFVSGDSAFKLPVKLKAIDITDKSLFILKPGDSSTMMNTHTFINEPVQEELQKAMVYLYRSHERDNIIKKAQTTLLINTWAEVASFYKQAFEIILSNTDKSERLK